MIGGRVGVLAGEGRSYDGVGVGIVAGGGFTGVFGDGGGYFIFLCLGLVSKMGQGK